MGASQGFRSPGLNVQQSAGATGQDIRSGKSIVTVIAEIPRVQIFGPPAGTFENKKILEY